MEKKVLLKELVDTGTNLRKQITSKVRVSDEGVYPIGELWDANTTLDVIINGAHEDHNNIRELDTFAHNTDRDLRSEINRATTAEQNLENTKADKVDVYTKDEVDNIVGDDLTVVDQYAKYSFTFYSSLSNNELASGVAQLTGVVSGDFTEIIVLESTEESFIGLKSFIPTNVQADGSTKYTVYNSQKEDTGVLIAVTKQSDTTYKSATIKLYIDYTVEHADGFSGNVSFDSVGAAQIIDRSIGMNDLSDEVKNKMKVTINENDESVAFGQ